MHPPKTIFLTFSSETKIMKIIHSAHTHNLHIPNSWKIIGPKNCELRGFIVWENKYKILYIY